MKNIDDAVAVNNKLVGFGVFVDRNKTLLAVWDTWIADSCNKMGPFGWLEPYRDLSAFEKVIAIAVIAIAVVAAVVEVAVVEVVDAIAGALTNTFMFSII